MLVFNLVITLVLIAVLAYLGHKLGKRLNLDNRSEEILLSWFMALALVIGIRCIANVALHAVIDNKQGPRGRLGVQGSRGKQGNNAEC